MAILKDQFKRLAKLKHRLKVVIDSMDSITKDPNVSLTDSINFERVKLKAPAILRETIELNILRVELLTMT
jgi:hypothetical protein